MLQFDFHRLSVKSAVNPAGVTERDESEQGNVEEIGPNDSMPEEFVKRLKAAASEHKNHKEKQDKRLV